MPRCSVICEACNTKYYEFMLFWKRNIFVSYLSVEYFLDTTILHLL